MVENFGVAQNDFGDLTVFLRARRVVVGVSSGVFSGAAAEGIDFGCPTMIATGSVISIIGSEGFGTCAVKSLFGHAFPAGALVSGVLLGV